MSTPPSYSGLDPALANYLPLNISCKDIKGTFLFANKLYCETLGRKLDEILGKKESDLFPRELVERYREEDLRVAQMKQMDCKIEERRKADGSKLFVQTLRIPLYDPEGQVVGIQEIFWNVTDRRLAGEALLESNRQLAEAILELKKTQANMIKQERLHALGQMASGIAHDFNNTLMPILGFSEVLLMNTEALKDGDRVKRYIQKINIAAKDATKIVGRLRGFYRLRQEDEIFRALKLNELVEETIELTEPKWKEQALANGIQILLKTDLAEITPIAGNESELREVLTNLIFNAVDAMPERGTLTLRTRQEPEHVVLEVADTGTGMTEEVRSRCMEPFFSTKGERGTGLGLAIVFGVVHRHGGSIEIETDVGHGTTFILRFPAQSLIPINKESSAEGPTRSTRKLQVLVVEDDPAVREVLASYLVQDGHVFETAENGREGLQKFYASWYHVVLTDLAMPEMNGDQLAIYIKRIAPNKPVILLTGFGDMIKAVDKKPEGIDLVLTKPITLDVLREAFKIVIPN